MKKINNTIKILKDLITIPSWVDNKTNESDMAKFCFDYLKKNSKLKITKQKVARDRFNVIAQKGNRVDILVTGHMDTVQPTSNWTKNPTIPTTIGNKLYGLGSSDMKSGVTIMLNVATQPKLSDNTMFLFYCDEEYDFLGMKKFISKYKNKIKPKLIVSLDGEGLQIGNSCRGLIELTVSVTGKTGHAARPKSGINAITQSMIVIDKLRSWLNKYSTVKLGNSTLNIAYIKGGTNMGLKNDEVLLGKEGNIIPDYCEYVVEIRVASQNLNTDLVGEFIKTESITNGLKIRSIKVRHDLGSWVTQRGKLEDIISLAPKKKLKNAKESGYIDIQMLWEAFGKVPTFSLGAGENGMSHKADEFVRISSILKAQKFYESILTKQ